MSRMDEMAAWFRAQLDEEERVALAAIADDCGQVGGFEDAYWLVDARLVKPRFGDAAAAMIRRFAVPRTALADVKAKRCILDRWETAAWDERAALSWVVEQLAQPYAGRPGWRAEWAV